MWTAARSGGSKGCSHVKGWGEENYQGREGTWLVSDRKTFVDGMGPELQNAVSVKSPTTFMAVISCLLPPNGQGREGCEGQNDVA